MTSDQRPAKSGRISSSWLSLMGGRYWRYSYGVVTKVVEFKPRRTERPGTGTRPDTTGQPYCSQRMVDRWPTLHYQVARTQHQLSASRDPRGSTAYSVCCGIILPPQSTSELAGLSSASMNGAAKPTVMAAAPLASTISYADAKNAPAANAQTSSVRLHAMLSPERHSHHHPRSYFLFKNTSLSLGFLLTITAPVEPGRVAPPGGRGKPVPGL